MIYTLNRTSTGRSFNRHFSEMNGTHLNVDKKTGKIKRI